MYSYEVYPQREFRPDVFIDIGDVLEPVIETINFFRKLNAESPQAERAGHLEAMMKVYPSGEELPLTAWAELKLCTSRVRGHQCGLRFAEAYRALDSRAVGNRLLDEIVS